MAAEKLSEKSDQFIRLLKQLQDIRKFNGNPSEFWPAYLNLLVRITDAQGALIATRSNDGKSGWRLLAADAGIADGTDTATMAKYLDTIAEETLAEGVARTESFPFDVLGVRLETGFDTETSLAVIAIQNTSRTKVRNLLDRLQLVSDVPASYQLQRVAVEATKRVEHFADVLDLMVLINEQKRFLATLMTFCNELAFRQKCERVSVGWMEKSYIRLKAISHVDRFDKKSEAVKRLEQTMEEAFDQNAEIAYPNIHTGVIYREHQNYSRGYDVENVCSVPIRADDKPIAVATFERNTEPFTELELRLLRLACDQTATHLSDLQMKDRWIGARLARGIKDGLGKLIGYEHTWAKVIGVGIAVAIGILIFAKMEYRVKAPVILRTDDVASAPFGGHIADVQVRVGDEVMEGDGLLNLDDKNLYLQRAALTAEYSQYTREFEKTRAQNELAEMRINQARRDQVAARLALVDYQLGQSALLSQFDGIVVEGDLRERIGAPVEQGEVLFKLARVDELYAELEVDEADIHEIAVPQPAEMALAASPQLNYPMKVDRIEPVAIAQEDGNIFITHCSFPEGVQGWWRPGMTGVAKISAGRRSILWVSTHRTVDFFRMRLWW